MNRKTYILTFHLTDTKHVYFDIIHQIQFYHTTMSFFIMRLKEFLTWLKEHPSYIITKINLEEREEGE